MDCTCGTTLLKVLVIVSVASLLLSSAHALPTSRHHKHHLQKAQPDRKVRSTSATNLSPFTHFSEMCNLHCFGAYMECVQRRCKNVISFNTGPRHCEDHCGMRWAECSSSCSNSTTKRI